MASHIRNVVRFEDSEGRTHYGAITFNEGLEISGSVVELLSRDPFDGDVMLSGKTSVIKRFALSSWSMNQPTVMIVINSS